MNNDIPAKVYAPRHTTLELALKVCSYCLQPPAPGKSLQFCAACKRAVYCDIACQSGDWRFGHRKTCRRLRTLNSNENQRWAQESDASREIRIEMQPLARMICTQTLGMSSAGIVHCAVCLCTPYQQFNSTFTKIYPSCSRCKLAWWCSEECKEHFDNAHTPVDCKTLQRLACVERFKIDYHVARRQFQPLMLTSAARHTYLDISSLSGWPDYYRKVFTDHHQQMARAALEFPNNNNAKLAATLLVQDTLTIPLTIADGLAHAFPDLAGRESLRIHVLDANEREASTTGVTEELLHLLPALQSLDIRYIGPNAQPNDVTGQPIIYKEGNLACAQCQPRGRSRTVEPHSSAYHECPWSRAGDPAAPDFIVAFNYGMSKVAQDAWSESLEAVLDLGVPALFTAYTLMECTAEEKLVRDLGAKVIRGVTENKWASGVPITNTYWSDEDLMGDDGPQTTVRNNRWLLMVQGRDV